MQFHLQAGLVLSQAGKDRGDGLADDAGGEGGLQETAAAVADAGCAGQERVSTGEQSACLVQ
ncbi:hypothetical protein [Streptomyces sp. NBC_00536]|uniref:hypothetical protein n=1 Tax=Streptomyces sp. NBC_00536 TaxID=2975769 RepID=UPI003FCE4ED5